MLCFLDFPMSQQQLLLRRSVRKVNRRLALPSRFENSALHSRQVVAVAVDEEGLLQLEVLLHSSPSASLTTTSAHPYLVGSLHDTVGIVAGLCSSALGNDDPVTEFGQLYYSCSVDWKFGTLGDHSTSAGIAQADLWEIGSDELVIDAFLLASTSAGRSFIDAYAVYSYVETGGVWPLQPRPDLLSRVASEHPTFVAGSQSAGLCTPSSSLLDELDAAGVFSSPMMSPSDVSLPAGAGDHFSSPSQDVHFLGVPLLSLILLRLVIIHIMLGAF